MNVFEPKVSIITICLNSREHIEDTIKSVRSQTYSNIEYIVIDGGSTDGTADILRAYDRQIDYWVSEPDKGISDAFNKGVLAATGEIVAFLNSQDYYFNSGVVAKAVRIFSEHPGANLVYGKTCYVPERSDEIVGVMGLPFSKEVMRKRNIMPHQSLFMKKTVFEHFGLYKQDYHYAMDYEHLLRVTETETPCFVDEIWAVMRLGGVSDSNKFSVNADLLKAQIHCGVPFLRAFRLLLYHDMTALGLKVLRLFNVYTLDHLFRKIGVGHFRKQA
jgi:glycosyltransferase